MISGLPRLLPSRQHLLAFLIPLFILAIVPQAVRCANADFTKGTTYQDGAGKLDYRNISTLSEFTRLVYKDRWLDIRAEYVLEQMAQFKGAARSPALREIWRDVLLGDFSGLKINSPDQQATLMAERIKLLNRLGYFDEAVRLYNKAAELKPVPEIVVQQGIEALALSGSADGACLEVYMAANYLKGSDWVRDSALCASYFGDADQAKALYQKAKQEAGSGFSAVYQMLNKEASMAIHVGIPPLWRTLLLAKRATITSEALTQADPMTLAAMAINKRVPLETRLVAANRAADAGTIGSDQLRKLYELKHPANTGMEKVIADAKSGTAMPQWDYYSSARFVFDGNSRAAIVKNALGHMSPVTNMKGQVYSWIVDKLTLQVDRLAWFAPQGYAILASTNRLPSAMMYYKVGKLENSRFALMNALLQGTPWPEANIAVWKDAMKAHYKGKADQMIDEMLRLANAYDQEKKLALNVGVTQPPQNPETFSLFKEATRRGGRGLTLVTALNFVGSAKTVRSIPQDQFIDIIDNMTKEGLFKERKKLTLEFLIQTML